jgi:2-oxoglutarate ferredoxin oxidoreductase subunit beta
LLDILQPCVSFNTVNTYRWYSDRVKPVEDSHDPTDRRKALELALQWGDEIPIGVVYRGRRPSFESQLPVLGKAPLVEQCGLSEAR